MAPAKGLIDRERLVCIGRISGAHGMAGEVKVAALTDTPERYSDLPVLLLDTVRGLRAFDVEAVHLAGGQWTVKLKGVTGRDGAEALKGAEILIAPEQVVPPEADEFYTEDLTGCAVETMAGQAVGTVTGILDAGSQQVLQVQGRDGEVLVPLAETIVKEVNLDRRTIRIDPPPGLLELNRL